MTITVRVPKLLVPVTGTERFTVQATTVAEALDAIIGAQPGLRTHLYDETGRLRPHVRIFYNDDDITWLDDLGAPVAEGDTITVVQAVSGG